MLWKTSVRRVRLSPRLPGPLPAEQGQTLDERLADGAPASPKGGSPTEAPAELAGPPAARGTAGWLCCQTPPWASDRMAWRRTAAFFPRATSHSTSSWSPKGNSPESPSRSPWTPPGGSGAIDGLEASCGWPGKGVCGQRLSVLGCLPDSLTAAFCRRRGQGRAPGKNRSPNPTATGPSLPPPARGAQGLPWEAAHTGKLDTGPVVRDRQRPPL